MYLKSVDIVGFKSFADRTRVELKPGITGIVGPNGCGKSNIMESIRWCIGEMSWKSLRSSSMVQVIFAGTSKRPATNLSEVTLTFDNASSLLPVQYSEVQVTRRLFRSGESEYLLNKTQCRLRDIRELFLDTGIGTGGYALINQGNVDFVLRAKPEERRALFEEAAGVSKYKAKREEALRKLDAVDQDMARLSDQLTLIDEQIRKLEREAGKAKLFKKYKEELEGVEGAVFVREIEQLSGQVAAIEARLAPVRESSDRALIEADQAEAELETLNIEKTERENEVLRFNEGLSKLKEQVGRLEERLRHSEARREELALRIDSLGAEIEADQRRAEELQPDVERLLGELEEARRDRDQMGQDVERLRGALEEAREAFARAQAEAGSVEAESARTAEARQALAKDLSRAESDFAHLQVEARSAMRDLEKSRARAGETRERLSGLGRELDRREALLGAARGAHEAARERVLEAKSALDRAERESVEVRTGLAETGAKLEAIQAHRDGDRYYAAAQAVSAAGLPGVLGLLRRLVEVEGPYRGYAEELLGEQLGSVVVEDSVAAAEAVRWLRERGGGRARFLVLSALPDHAPGSLALPAGARMLLSSVRADERVSRLMEQLLGEVYLLGSALHGPFWVLGGSDELPEGTGWLEEGELSSRRARLSERKTELEAARLHGHEVLRAAEEARSASERAARGAEALSQKARHVLEERQRTLALADEEAALIELECRRHLAGIAEQLERSAELRERGAGLRTEEERLLGRLEEARRGREEARRASSERQAEHDGLASRHKHQAAQVGFLEDQERRLEEALDSIRQSRARREKEREEAGARIEELRAEEQGGRESLKGLEAELAAQEGRSREVFDRLTESRAKADAKAAEASRLKKGLSELRESLHGIEMELADRRTREELARARLAESCGLGFEEAKERFAGQQADAERVDWLKKRIAQLGNVNMTAPEEMDELRQRDGFLRTQSEDLLKAKEDLKQAIGKINANTRENFRHTFEQVQEHFRRLYGVLFEGGEADLVLTQPDNLLETGVEIVAQPPGKKLQSISQLSGGEKALTALALLFSFFSVRPSPFCFLDEADAALDEANVDRFVNLLKSFSDRTQTILISHNKRTMEAADVIYGVTMEESGVSMLLSVELEGRGRPGRPRTDGEPEKDAAASA